MVVVCSGVVLNQSIISRQTKNKINNREGKNRILELFLYLHTKSSHTFCLSVFFMSSFYAVSWFFKCDFLESLKLIFFIWFSVFCFALRVDLCPKFRSKKRANTSDFWVLKGVKIFDNPKFLTILNFFSLSGFTKILDTKKYTFIYTVAFLLVFAQKSFFQKYSKINGGVSGEFFKGVLCGW